MTISLLAYFFFISSFYKIIIEYTFRKLYNIWEKLQVMWIKHNEFDIIYREFHIPIDYL